MASVGLRRGWPEAKARVRVFNLNLQIGRGAEGGQAQWELGGREGLEEGE